MSIHAVPHHHRTPYRRLEERYARQQRAQQQYRGPSPLKRAWNDADEWVQMRFAYVSLRAALLIVVVGFGLACVAVGLGG